MTDKYFIQCCALAGSTIHKRIFLQHPGGAICTHCAFLTTKKRLCYWANGECVVYKQKNEDLVLWTWCNMLLAFVLQEEEKIVQCTPTSLDKKTVNEDQKRVL